MKIKKLSKKERKSRDERLVADYNLGKVLQVNNNINNLEYLKSKEKKTDESTKKKE